MGWIKLNIKSNSLIIRISVICDTVVKVAWCDVLFFIYSFIPTDYSIPFFKKENKKSKGKNSTF